jgi:hypothetical protein
MIKYYRVKKDTPMWKEGAIIANTHESTHYVPIEDIWDQVPGVTDDFYEHARVVEAPEASEFFERVYKNDFDKAVWHTAEELRKLYGKFKPEKK